MLVNNLELCSLFLPTAYEVLSDADKRKKYDRFGEGAYEQGGSGSPGTGHHDFNFDFKDFFSDFDSAFNAHSHGQKAHGGFNFGGSNTFTFEDFFDDSLFGEDDEFGDPFGSFFGGGGLFDDFDLGGMGGGHHQRNKYTAEANENLRGHGPATASRHQSGEL